MIQAYFLLIFFILFPNSSVPPLKAGEKSSTKFKLTPVETGSKHLLVNFSCDKFSDIKAFKTVNVID